MSAIEEKEAKKQKLEDQEPDQEQEEEEEESNTVEYSEEDLKLGHELIAAVIANDLVTYSTTIAPTCILTDILSRKKPNHY